MNVCFFLSYALKRPKFLDQFGLYAVCDRECEPFFAGHIPGIILVVCAGNDDLYSHSLKQREVRFDLGQMPRAVGSPVAAIERDVCPATCKVSRKVDLVVADELEGDVWKVVAGR